jgi:hypothetical protein
MEESPRRKFLTTTTLGLGSLLAGCSRIGADDRSSDTHSIQEFYDEVPEESVKIDASFSRSNSEEADIRADLHVSSIPPSGDHGSLGISLNVVGDQSAFVEKQDTLHHVDDSGFEEIERGVWKWDRESDTPHLTVDIEFGEREYMNFTTLGSTTVGSYDFHVNSVVEDITALYHSTEYDEAASVPVEAEITLEEPSFGGEYEGRFVLFGPHERVRLLHPDFEIHVVGLPEFFPTDDPVVIAQLLDEVRQTLRLGGDIERAYGWAFPLAPDVSGLAYGTNDGVGTFTAKFGLKHIWIHEYIHLEQQFSELGDDMLWFKEASANYYAELAMFYAGQREFDRFRGEMSELRWSDPVVDIPHRTHDAAYDSDAVLAALDAEIRMRSGDETLAAVFRMMNAHSGTMNYDSFSDLVAEAAGERLDDWMEAHLLEPVDPSIPDDPELFGDRERYDIPLRRDIKKGEVETTSKGVSGTEPPPVPVVRFYLAIINKSPGVAEATIHSDSPHRHQFAEILDRSESNEYEIKSVTTKTEAEYPVVSVVVVVTDTETGQTDTLNQDIEVRKNDDGVWKLFRIL